MPTPQVPQISSDRKYWFVRTNNGDHYDVFKERGYIAIGWNSITATDLKELDHDKLKVRISQDPDDRFDPNTTAGKQKATLILNKLLRFNSLKPGDAVIVPSMGSRQLSFGEIQDEEIFTEKDSACRYFKKRRVKWVAEHELKTLDPIFYKMKVSWHAVSEITDYTEHIDKAMYPIFVKGDFMHLVLDVERDGDVNLQGLVLFSEQAVKLIQRFEGLQGEESSQTTIKINVQSPGKIELIKPGKALLFLGTLLTMGSCSVSEARQATEVPIIQNDLDLAQQLRDSVNDIGINTRKLAGQ